jgi:hypothetical protein
MAITVINTIQLLWLRFAVAFPRCTTNVRVHLKKRCGMLLSITETFSQGDALHNHSPSEPNPQWFIKWKFLPNKQLSDGNILLLANKDLRMNTLMSSAKTPNLVTGLVPQIATIVRAMPPNTISDNAQCICVLGHSSRIWAQSQPTNCSAHIALLLVAVNVLMQFINCNSCWHCSHHNYYITNCNSEHHTLFF